MEFYKKNVIIYPSTRRDRSRADDILQGEDTLKIFEADVKNNPPSKSSGDKPEKKWQSTFTSEYAEAHQDTNPIPSQDKPQKISGFKMVLSANSKQRHLGNCCRESRK